VAYQVKFKPSVEKELRKLQKKELRRVIGRVEELGQNPRPPGTGPVHGEQNVYRIRVGDYRIIYELREEEKLVFVLKVSHRSAVYDEFRRMRSSRR